MQTNTMRLINFGFVFLLLGSLGEACQLDVSNSHLRAPVLYRNGIILDVYNDDTVEMNVGDLLTAECSGENNLIENLEVQSKNFECVSSGRILVDEQIREFSYLDCLRTPDIYTFSSSDEKCGPDNDLSLVHLSYGNSATKLLTVCLNGSNPEWVKYSVEDNYANNIQKLRHLRYMNDDNISPLLLSMYQRTFQNQELAKMLLPHYVHICTAEDERCTYNDGFFITPAALSSAQHFKKFGAQKAAENYVTSKPIWDNIRKGNLKKIHKSIGVIGATKNLTVVSGSREQLVLRNSALQNKNIEFKKENETVVVPKYIWIAAVSYAPELNDTQGVGVLILNRIETNTLNLAPPSEVGGCSMSLCSSLTYLDINNENIDQGYVYCCDLAALQDLVTLEIELPLDVPLLV